MKRVKTSYEVPIKVAVRLKPMLPNEGHSNVDGCIQIHPKSGEVVILQEHAFKFDSAFTSEATQDEIFDRCIKPLLSNVFRGFNATVFAYGQTGSGKTYTMGIEDTQKIILNRKGIIPQSVEWIFNQIEAVEIRNLILPKVRVSFIEIYQEELHDLLDPSPTPKKLFMRENQLGVTVVQGMREETCTSTDEVYKYLKIGTALRHTGATQMNEKSSRSHSIFTFILEQASTDLEESQIENGVQTRLVSKLHFVDLAGSERAKKTGNTGKMLKESVYINGGLLALNTVINSLTDTTRAKNSHIPYRQSKLTRMLKDSLGGTAMTMMICCISPYASDLYESISTLKYAAEARNIKNNPCMNWKSLQRKAEFCKKAGIANIKKGPVKTRSLNESKLIIDKSENNIVSKLIILCQTANNLFRIIPCKNKYQTEQGESIRTWQNVWKQIHVDFKNDSSPVNISSGTCMEDPIVPPADDSIEEHVRQAITLIEQLSSKFKERTNQIEDLELKVKKLEGSLKSCKRRNFELELRLNSEPIIHPSNYIKTKSCLRMVEFENSPKNFVKFTESCGIIQKKVGSFQVHSKNQEVKKSKSKKKEKPLVVENNETNDQTANRDFHLFSRHQSS